MIDSKQSELHSIVDSELVENIGQVMLDGVFADAKRFGDILVCLSLNQRIDNLQFALRQAKSRFCRSR